MLASPPPASQRTLFAHIDKKTAAHSLDGRFLCCFGITTYLSRDGRIRTGDPLNPIQVRYRAAPRPESDKLTRPGSGLKGLSDGRP